MDPELRAMSVGEILRTALRLMADHLVLLTAIPAVIYVPLALAGGLLSARFDAADVLVAVVVGLAAMAVSPVVTGAITYALAEVRLGRAVTVGDALRVGLALAGRLVGTWLLGSLAVLGGFLLLVVPGVYLALCLLPLTQVMICEGVFGVAALRRSRELMRGHLLRGLALAVLVAVLSTVLSVVLDAALDALPLVAPLGAGIVQAASVAWGSAVMVLLYLDVRSRKEAFGREDLRAAVTAVAAGATPGRSG